MENEKYLKQIIKDFDKEVKAIKNARSSHEITDHQRVIYPLLVELQLAIPRLNDDIVKLARDTRKALAEK